MSRGGDLSRQLMRQIRGKTCRLCSEEICQGSDMLPGYVCQDPVLDLIPASAKSASLCVVRRPSVSFSCKYSHPRGGGGVVVRKFTWSHRQ